MCLKIIPFPVVNFTNIVQADFFMKVYCAVFLYLQFGFVFFWQLNTGAIAAQAVGLL